MWACTPTYICIYKLWLLMVDVTLKHVAMYAKYIHNTLCNCLWLKKVIRHGTYYTHKLPQTMPCWSSSRLPKEVYLLITAIGDVHSVGGWVVVDQSFLLLFFTGKLVTILSYFRGKVTTNILWKKKNDNCKILKCLVYLLEHISLLLDHGWYSGSDTIQTVFSLVTRWREGRKC